MAVSEAIPEVLAVLLGDVYKKLSAKHATNDFNTAHIRTNEYWQENIGILMPANKSIEAFLFDMSPNKVPVASIDMRARNSSWSKGTNLCESFDCAPRNIAQS